MKVETPQILWNSEGDKNVNAALLSVALLDLRTSTAPPAHRPHPTETSPSPSASLPPVPSSSSSSILATAGNSSVINLWNDLKFQCSLTRVDGVCNCVRFSPDGLHLAAAGEHVLAVWSVPPAHLRSRGRHHWAFVEREQDLTFHVAARHGEAFMDLCWSPDSARIVAGSIDHSVVVCELQGQVPTVAAAAAASPAVAPPLGDRATNIPALDPSSAAAPSSAAMVPSYHWKTVYRHDDHSHFVQGVAYDPLQFYVASMSSDRTVRLHARKLPKRLSSAGGAGGTATTPDSPAASLDVNALELTKSKIIKYRATAAGSGGGSGGSAAPPNHRHPSKEVEAGGESPSVSAAGPPPAARYLFHDEASLESFVRRLAFTCDGAFLIVPAARWDLPTTSSPPSSTGGDAPVTNATLLFARHKWDEPCRVLVGFQKPAIAIRPCPVFFELPDDAKENSCQGLPYRSVFAVLTWDSVVIYDTVHAHPLGIVTGLHYCNLVDAAWSNDGRTLLVCSTDGYISIVQFEEGELGRVHPGPAQSLNVTVAEPAVPAVAVATTSAATSSGDVTSAAAAARPVLPRLAAPTLPPCEPGLASVEARPTKRAKLTTLPLPVVRNAEDDPHAAAAHLVHQMTLRDPATTTAGPLAAAKPKKRIQPISLVSTNQ